MTNVGTCGKEECYIPGNHKHSIEDPDKLVAGEWTSNPDKPAEDKPVEAELPDGTKYAEPKSTTGHYTDPNGVNHPVHYNQHPSGVECIDVIENLSFNIGSAVKYIWRAGLKSMDDGDPTKDLKKAEWYLSREINRLAPNKAPGTDITAGWKKVLVAEPSADYRQIYIHILDGWLGQARDVVRLLIGWDKPVA